MYIQFLQYLIIFLIFLKILELIKIKKNYIVSYLYTNEIAQRDENQSNLVNIIDPLIIWNDTLIYYPYIVTNEESMRPDLICFSIYNNFSYIDELLLINNILNPWSIKAGQTIYYIDEDSILILQRQYKNNEEKIIKNLVNPNKDTKKDPNRDSGTGLSPTIKPSGLKDVSIDFNDKTIKIIDRFK